MKEEDFTKNLQISKEEITERYRKSNASDLFGLVKDDNNKIKLVIGECIVSEAEFDSWEEADDYIMEKPWELIYNVIMVCMYYEKKIKKEQATKA